MIGIDTIKKIFIALLALTAFIQYELILALFTSVWDFGTLLFVIPFLALLTGCVFLWTNHKIGIVLLGMYSAYSGAALLSAGLIRLLMFVAADGSTNSHVTYMIFPTFEPVIQVFVGFVFLVICLILSRGKLLEDAEVNKGVFYRGISLAGVLAWILVFK